MVEEIKKDLESLLSEYRYNHCLRVGETAASLAKHYKINAEEAYLAGLTHDIAKEFTMEENEQFIKEHNLDENLLDPKNKKFIHGIVGAVLVREKYHFNKDMVNAIYYHTTGRPNMSDLEKIVYLADKIEPGKNYQGIEEERRLAYQDLDKAVILCLETKIKKQDFDFEDFLDQMEQIQKMGSMDKILGMIPGMGDIKNQLGDVDMNGKEMNRIKAIIQSMTVEERRNPQILNASRKRRIAKGSGTSVQEVNKLIKQLNEMKKMMKMFTSNSKGMKKRGALGGLPFFK